MAKEGDPMVCKLMDHGKHIFDSKKQKSASRKKQKRIQIKEIKFRPVTEENDYQIKVNKIKSFLEDGNKAKVTLRFRGREMAHQNIGMKLLKRVEKDLEDIPDTVLKDLKISFVKDVSEALKLSLNIDTNNTENSRQSARTTVSTERN